MLCQKKFVTFMNIFKIIKRIVSGRRLDNWIMTGVITNQKKHFMVFLTGAVRLLVNWKNPSLW